MQNNTLRSSIVNEGMYNEKMILGEIKIIGINMKTVKRILINNREIHEDTFSYNKSKSVSNQN